MFQITFKRFMYLSFLSCFIIFYRRGPMRNTVQKQKFTSALKHMMSCGHSQTSPQVLNQNKEDQPSISIINFDSFNVQGLQGASKHVKKIKRFPPFCVTRGKYQLKAQRCFSQNKKISQESQELAAKFKSERLRKFASKKKSQYLQRIQTEPFKKYKEQDFAKQGCQKSKDKFRNKTQCYSLKKKSQNSLIQNIKTLRKKQTIFVYQEQQSNENENFSSQSNRVKTSQSLMKDIKSGQLELGQGSIKQETLNKLKMHIKNKLSRRRMYNATNESNQIFSNTTLKIRNFSNDKQKICSSDSFHNEQDQITLQKKPNNNLKTLQVRTIKNYITPVLLHGLSIKIQSKPAQIVCDILKCKQQYMRNNMNKLQKTLRIVNGNNTFSCFNQSSVNNPEQTSEFLRKKQQTRRQNRAKKQKTCKNLQTNEGQNMFRILTPWHDNSLQ